MASRQRKLPMCWDKTGSAQLLMAGPKNGGKTVLDRRGWGRGEGNRQLARPLQPWK